jgi:hypothetical protein
LGAGLHRRKKDGSSLLKKNRNLDTHSVVLKAAAGTRLPLAGPPLSGEDLVPLIPATAYRAVTGGDQPDWPVPLAGRIPGLGQGRLVISCETAALTGPSAGLVTNRADWTAQRSIATSLPRWPIEPFYQEGKEPLGLDEYRMRPAEASKKQGCLVFVAYSLLPRDCLPPSPLKGHLPRKTIGEAGRQPAQALIEALILQTHERLQLGQKAKDVFAH